MKTQPPPEYLAQTIFCDDIRHEITGKAIFIGVYTHVMIVGTGFPVTIPMFSFWIKYIQRDDVALKENAKIKIFLPGDDDKKSSIEGELLYSEPPPNDEIQNHFANAVDSIYAPGEHKYLQMVGQFSFAPLVIKQPGVIKVRAVRHNELIRFGALNVLPAPVLPTK